MIHVLPPETGNEITENYLLALQKVFSDLVIHSDSVVQANKYSVRTKTKTTLSFFSRFKKNKIKNLTSGDLLFSFDKTGSQIKNKAGYKHFNFYTNPTNNAVIFKKTGFQTLVPSQYCFDLLLEQGVPLEQMQKIHPPLINNDTASVKQEHHSFIVGMISPLQKNRGVETLIRALNLVREIIPQLKIIIVGDGPEKKQLHWLIDHLHLRKRVQFVTSNENYQRFLVNFDILVSAENIPKLWNNAIIYAMSQSIPVIATKTGVNPEIIEHGQTGLLFQPDNSHMLSQHLINLYNHPDWRHHYQQTGPRLIEQRFGMVKFEKVIKNLL